MQTIVHAARFLLLLFIARRFSQGLCQTNNIPLSSQGKRKGKERKGKERKGKERKGKERKGKEWKRKERKGKDEIRITHIIK